MLLSRQNKQGRNKSGWPQLQEQAIVPIPEDEALVAGAWTERQKMYHGGSFLKLADDNMDIQNPEAQNRDLSGF